MELIIVIALIVWSLAGAAGKKGQKKTSGNKMRDVSTFARKEPLRQPSAERTREGSAASAGGAVSQPPAPPRGVMPTERPSVLFTEPSPPPRPAAARVRPSMMAEPEQAPAQEIPGLSLSFSKNAVVQGVIYSEILGSRPRPGGRRNTCSPYAR